MLNIKCKSLLPLLVQLIISCICALNVASAQTDNQKAQLDTHIQNIKIDGQPIIVFDHLKDQQEPLNSPDGPAHAWKESDGTVNLTIPRIENYRMHGSDLEHLKIDPNKSFSSQQSASDEVENHYNNKFWIFSPYTLDGKTTYALAHSEWYGCLLNSDCKKGKDNQKNSWVATISSFKSSNGGATWSLNGKNEQHVVAHTGITWTGSPELASKLYTKAMNNTGFFHPSRIIKEGNYYYATAYLMERDLTKLSPVTNLAPPIPDKRGFVIMRTLDISKPTSWEGWVSGDTFEPMSNKSYHSFLPQINNKKIASAASDIIYDINAKVYILTFVANHGEDKSIFFITSPSLANPNWSEAKKIIGSNNFHINPRKTSNNDNCDLGFEGLNYASLNDPASSGLNFEFTNGKPWLFYSIFPPRCGGRNDDRDIYRVSLQIEYSH